MGSDETFLGRESLDDTSPVVVNFTERMERWHPPGFFPEVF
jgi:hypothetical protein